MTRPSRNASRAGEIPGNDPVCRCQQMARVQLDLMISQIVQNRQRR